MEAFNLFNRAQFAAPSADVNSPTTVGVVASQANRLRILQFALWLHFCGSPEKLFNQGGTDTDRCPMFSLAKKVHGFSIAPEAE